MNIFIYLIILASFTTPADATSELSYSGRLVNSTGVPVTGPVNLFFEVSHSASPSTVLCSKTVNSVGLTNGVFHVSLDIDDSDCSQPFLQVLEAPAGQSVVLRVTDLTNSRVYPVQALKSVPFSIQAKTLAQMGATTGQVLKWDGSKWTPDTDGGGAGSVTEVATGSGLEGGPITSTGTISIATGGVTSTHIADSTITNADINAGAAIARTKLASGTANQVVINDGSGVLSSTASLPVTLGGTGANNASDARTNLGLGTAAPRDVFGATAGELLAIASIPECPAHQKIQRLALPLGFTCVTDNDSADASKLPLAGGTMSGPINMGSSQIINLVDPVNLQDAATRNYVENYVATQITGVNQTQWTDSGSDIYFDNNVGIGATTPSQKLDVIGNIFLGSSSALTRQLQLFGRDSAGTDAIIGYNAPATNPLLISTTANNNNISLFPHGTGHVEVKGTGTNKLIFKDDANGNAHASLISFEGASDGIHGTVGFASNINEDLSVIAQKATGDLVLGAGGDIVTKRIRLKSDTGFVGLGTDTPGARLEVNGLVKITGGTPGVGKVLTSDGTGLATWISPPSGGISTLTGDVAASGSGSVAATINNSAITTAKIADGAVNSAKILNATILDEDIANTTITYGKLNLADGSIPAAKLNLPDTIIATSKLIPLSCTGNEVVVSSAMGGFTCADPSDATKLPLAGGTMTGTLVLAGAPSSNLHAATKQYVDATVSAAAGVTALTGDVTGTGPGSTTTTIATGVVTSAKIADGTIATVDLADSSVTSLKIANGTIVDADISASAAIAYSKINIANGDIPIARLVAATCTGSQVVTGTSATGFVCAAPADSTKLPLAGGTMTGTLVLAADPTANLHAATKKYVDDRSFSVAGTAPVTVTGTTTRTISMSQANTTTNGFLSSTDWNTFNSKLASGLTSGRIFVGNGSGVATAVTMTGDGTLSNTGVLTLETVPVSKGGTGATTQAAAANAILPAQSGHSGKFLTTNGANTSWSTVTATPAGSNGQIQYNAFGSLGANANYSFNPATTSLFLGPAPSAFDHGFYLNSGTSSSTELSLRNSATGNFYTDGSRISATGTNLLIENREVGDIVFNVNGNVGINTTTPQTTLDVNGTATMSASTEGAVAYVNTGTSYPIPAGITQNIRRLTLTGNATITLPSTGATAAKMYTLTIFLKQDGTGNRSVTFAGGGSTIKWDGGMAPSISTTANMVTILQFTKALDESVWYGSKVWQED